MNMTEYKNISVVVPVYNSVETIKLCLEAILNMDYPEDNLEIIVVDDCSTDGTPEIVRSLNSSRITLVENSENKGRAYTRLRGAETSRYDNLLFVDSRVIVNEDILQFILSSCEPVQIPFVLEGNRNHWEFTLNTIRRRVFRKFYSERKPVYINRENFDENPKGTTSLFIPKTLFCETTNKIDYKNKYVSEDTLLLYKLVEAGNRIFVNPEYRVTYFQRDGFIPNIRHLYERGPRFVNFYFGRSKRFTALILFIAILFISFFTLVIWFPVVTLVVLAISAFIALFLFACFVGQSIKGIAIIIVYFPIIFCSFSAGVLKGLLIKLHGIVRGSPA